MRLRRFRLGPLSRFNRATGIPRKRKAIGSSHIHYQWIVDGAVFVMEFQPLGQWHDPYRKWVADQLRAQRRRWREQGVKAK
jgi:hypothetical protein